MADLTACSRVQFRSGSAAAAAHPRFGSDERQTPPTTCLPLSTLQIILHPFPSLPIPYSPSSLTALLHLDVSSSLFLKTHPHITRRYHYLRCHCCAVHCSRIQSSSRFFQLTLSRSTIAHHGLCRSLRHGHDLELQRPRIHLDCSCSSMDHHSRWRHGLLDHESRPAIPPYQIYTPGNQCGRSTPCLLGPLSPGLRPQRQLPLRH